MAGIVLLLPLVFSRWSAPAIIYDFFLFSLETMGGGSWRLLLPVALEVQILINYQGKGERIYIIIYTKYCIYETGVGCAQEKRLSGCI